MSGLERAAISEPERRSLIRSRSVIGRSSEPGRQSLTIFHRASQQSVYLLRSSNDPTCQHSNGLTVDPLVSFVVPCYNYGRYLGECLSSIFCQEGQHDFEVMVFNVAS